MHLGFQSNNLWLGTQESHQDVRRMLEAKDSGKLLELMAESPALQALSSNQDDEGNRIGARLYQVVEGVAVISVNGSLVSSYQWYNSWFGVVSYEEIRDALDMAVEDDNVKNIMMDVNSGGGAVVYLDDTADYIGHINRNIKPVDGHTSSGAYSAGYWLLSSARKVSASKMAGTGSIGVIMTTVSYSKALEEAGIKYEYIRSGEHKALGQIGEELTEAGKAELQDMVMQLHGFFEAHVTGSRGALAVQTMSQWNTGKTFLPKQAISLGLIDEVNTFDGHVAKLFQSSNNAVYLSTNTSLSKEAIMKLKSLTAEQQAQLASGVALAKLGLSDTELAAAQAEIASLQSEESEKDADAEEEKPAVEAAGGEEEITEEETPVAATVETTLLAANADLNKQLARAELAAEQKDVAFAELTAQVETLQATEKNLTAVVAEATNKLQVSLGGQASNFESFEAGAMLTQYAATKEKFEATFNVGPTSQAAVTKRSAQASLKPNNVIRKVTQE